MIMGMIQWLCPMKVLDMIVSVEGLSGLNSVSEGGVITAGNASQITDGAAAVMICNDAGLRKLKKIQEQ